MRWTMIPLVGVLILSGCSRFGGSGTQTIIEAAKAGNVARVKTIVEGDPSQMHAMDQNGNTPAILAILEGHKEIAIYLVDKGYPKDGTPQHPFPLIMACCSRYTSESDEMIEYLLKAGANPNVVYEKEGWLPLSMAVNNSMPNKVRLLVKYGARMDQADGTGQTPIQLARKRLADMRDPSINLPHGELSDPAVRQKAIDRWAAMVALLESLAASK